jgi:YjbE family integral membrane protein
MNLAGLTHDLSAFAQVLMIDIALAGDNAVVVGMAVAGLPARQQRPAIILGIGGATLIRIGFGAIALRMLELLGLLLAGGLLLLWVCWKMFRELRRQSHAGASDAVRPRKSLAQAMLQIILADVSMSLDNVLAVAGAAGGSVWVLAAGLAISVVLMGIAAGVLARILERQRWIAWAGLLIVLYVALHMIWQGGWAVAKVA